MKRTFLVSSILVLLAGLGYVLLSGSVFGKTSESFSTKKIKEIDVVSNYWDVQLVQTDSKKISVIADGVERNSKVKAEVKNNTLKIEQKNPESFALTSSVRKNRQLKILVPISYSKKINVETQSGDIELDKIPIKNISVTTTKGDIELQNVTSLNSMKTTITTSNGDIDVSFKTKPTNLKINMVSNDIDNQLGQTEFGKGENTLDLRCPKGEISIY